MIYVVVEELIPEAQTGPHSNISTVGVAARIRTYDDTGRGAGLSRLSLLTGMDKCVILGGSVEEAEVRKAMIDYRAARRGRSSGIWTAMTGDNDKVKAQDRAYLWRGGAEHGDCGTRMGLSAEDRSLARIIALLHDIGRFEQLKRYDSFHAGGRWTMRPTAYRCLFREGMIRRFVPEETCGTISSRRRSPGTVTLSWRG